MSHSEVAPLSGDQIDAILEYLPRFEAPDFTAGEWVTYPRQMPYFRPSSTFSDFLSALSQQNVLFVFDWTAWQGEAKRYFDDPESIAIAPLIDLRRLLTTHMRMERFNEGHFASMVDNGHILAILQRLCQLRAEMEI